MYMTAVGGAGAGVGAEEGDGGTTTITRGTGGWLRLQVLEKKAKWCPLCHPQWRRELTVLGTSAKWVE